MSHMFQQRERELVEKEAVKEVMLRYARGIDRQDYNMVVECFEPDAHAEYGGVDYGRGVDNIMKRLGKGRIWKRSMHFVGNQHVELAGDKATMETYAIAYLAGEHGGRHRILLISALVPKEALGVLW